MTSSRIAVPTPDGEMPAHLWLPEPGSRPGHPAAAGDLRRQPLHRAACPGPRRPRLRRARARDLLAAGRLACRRRSGRHRHRLRPAPAGSTGRRPWHDSIAAASTSSGSATRCPAGSASSASASGAGSPSTWRPGPRSTRSCSYYGSALPDLLGVVEADPRVARRRAGGGDGAVAAPVRHGRPVPDPSRGGAGPGRCWQPLPNVTWYGYETADHAFDNPDFFLHDPEASALAWQRTSTWLGQHLTRG